MEKESYLILIISLIVCCLIVLVSIRIEQDKQPIEQPRFLTYEKIVQLDCEYTLEPHQQFLSIGGVYHKTYNFDFTDGSHSFFIECEYTNPILPDILTPGTYKITYASATTGDYPWLLNIERME